MADRLERLLHPRHVAVVGGHWAEAVIRQCDAMGFAGDVWPVHPSREELAGRPCYRSVEDLPAAPDAAFVGVNRHASVDVIRALAARDAGGVIAFASGFRESSREDPEGADLETRLMAAAGSMPVIGPNCYGLINYLDGVPLWPDQHGGQRVGRGVAILTQSSNLAINITMQRRGLPVAYMVTVGNQAQTGLAEIARALLDDDRVSAVGLHIEGIDSARSFERMAAAARRRSVPVIALKVGRSQQARATALTHTASIAGSRAASDAFLERLGIAQVRSVPEFVETLKLLHVHGALPGADVCSLSCSGGEAALMSDAAEGRRVAFRTLSATGRARVKASLGEIVSVSNPLDYHTFIWAQEDALAATFEAMLAERFDLAMLVLDFPRLDRCSDADWDVSARAWKRAVEATGARAAMVATLPENLPEARCAALLADGIAPLGGLDAALAAADAAARIGAAWAAAPAAPVVIADGADCRGRVVLHEREAKRALASFGLAIPDGQLATGTPAAVAASRAVGYPVAVKITGNAHKSESRGVRLGLGDADAVIAAVEEFGIDRPLLIEHMVGDAVVELVVGVLRDPQFGLLLTVGAGGVLVEILGDTVSLLLPATHAQIRTALLSLRIAPLFSGYRGQPPADIEAAVDAIAAVADYAIANADTLLELDVNPLVVRPRGQGAVAVDALITQRNPP